MYKSIKSLAVLILFSTLFVSCANTQDNEIEKEGRDVKSHGGSFRNKMSRFERYER